MTVIKLKKELLDNKNTLKYLEQIAGPLAPEIINVFKKESALSPEDLAKKLKKKITNVRSTLNSLHYRGIACYKKVKNKQNMFEFYWEIKFKKIVEILLEHELENLKNLDESIHEKKDRDYFVCPGKCIEVPFEVAAAYNFKCPNCDKTLEILNNKSKITSLKRKKTSISKNIELLNKLLEKIEDHTRGYVCE